MILTHCFISPLDFIKCFDTHHTVHYDLNYLTADTRVPSHCPLKIPHFSRCPLRFFTPYLTFKFKQPQKLYILLKYFPKDCSSLYHILYKSIKTPNLDKFNAQYFIQAATCLPRAACCYL